MGRDARREKTLHEQTIEHRRTNTTTRYGNFMLAHPRVGALWIRPVHFVVYFVIAVLTALYTIPYDCWQRAGRDSAWLHATTETAPSEDA